MAVRAIFEEAFPPWQREAFEDLVSREETGQGFPVVLVAGTQPVALAVTSCLRSVQWSYLEYFAVAQERRGHGLGGQLWQAVSHDLAHRGQPGRIVLEVEDPAGEIEGTPGFRQRVRRIRFYERHGARALGVQNYVVPHVDNSEGNEPMILLWAPMNPGAPPPVPAEFRQLLTAVYAAGYGLTPGNSLVLAALHSLPGGPQGP